LRVLRGREVEWGGCNPDPEPEIMGEVLDDSQPPSLCE